jgi:two-component sensor histidine kinase
MTELPNQRPSLPEQILLRELNHRINNEFAAAISVVSLAATRSANNEVKTALTAVTQLLHHYASVHHALQMPEHNVEVSRIFVSSAFQSADPTSITEKSSLSLRPSLCGTGARRLATGNDCL